MIDFMYEGDPTIPPEQTIAAYRAEKMAARIAAKQPRYPGSVLAEAILFIAMHPVRHR